MSHKQKQKHRYKPQKKTPSLITNEDEINDSELVPLPTIQYNNDGNMVLDDISEIEVDETYMKYTGQYIEPPRKQKPNQLHELEDQEPYNRRESFLADMTHEPYWKDKESGHHPFQTPKSTKNGTTPSFFSKDIILNQNTESNTPKQNNIILLPKKRNSDSLSDSPTDNIQSISNGTNKSLEMVIPEENELIQMPIGITKQNTQTDIYSIDDTPNHNGRITTFAKNGQMNPISLYKIEYHNNDNDNDDDDSYESDHSDIIQQQQQQQPKRTSNGHNKRIITNSFLKTNTNSESQKKKVSFNANTNTINGGPTSPLCSPSLTPHLLIQSATNDNLELTNDSIATLTPNSNNNDLINNYNNINNRSKTAPTSPLQQKFKFSPQVSNIKNQRHSVVSIAMIQKVREKKILLNETNNGINTPSMSVCNSVDEEEDTVYGDDTFDVDNINVSYYNNDTHITNTFIQRSGTEDDILHRLKSDKSRSKLKKYRNGIQSTTTSPKYENGIKNNKKQKYNNNNNKMGWQKKAHSYRPQKERYGGASDSIYTLSQKHSKTPKPAINESNTNSIIPSTYSLRRTNSDISKNKNKNNKKNLIEEYKVPPSTNIINNNNNERHAKISDKNNNKKDELPSLFTSLSKNIVKDRMNKIDIENLIPLTVSRYISYMAEKTGNPKLTPPQRWDFTTVAMFADVSGFTKLSEYLAKAGAGGAEKLAFYLNRYLEQLANKARKEGGDVFKFAGDAIIIVWPPDFEEEKLEQSRQKILREERIARAVQAARGIQNEFHNMEIIKGAITLSVKIGIGYGPSSLLFVGGQFGRIEYLMCGSALKQAFDCESYASPGDVIISKEAYQYVKEKYVYGRAVYDDDDKNNNNNNNNNDILPQPIVYKVMLDRKKYKKVHSKALRSNGRYLINEHLQSFVPRAAWQRLILRYKPWHGEQRAVTVLFINLDFNAYDDDDNDNDNEGKNGKKEKKTKKKKQKKKRSNLENMPQDLLQKAVKTIQKCIYRYKGSLNKFLFDDKGSTVIAVFGLPPIANFDDCTRGVLAALLIEQKMKSLNIKARIGVTTGRVYIGVVGASGSASEYGILGDQVNLAARLMQHAIKPYSKGGLGGEGVVVSDTTYAQGKECINIEWQRLQSTSVKGFSKEFIIWRPYWRKIKGDLSMKRNRFFIGWKETMDEIKSRLLKLTKNMEKSRGYVVAIHADHWGGATQFARQLLHEIHEQIYVVGTTNLAFNDEKLFAWKALLTRIIRECRILRNGNNNNNNGNFQRSFILFLNDTNGKHLIQLLPVLNELLNTNFISENEEINILCPLINLQENENENKFGHKKLKSYTPNKKQPSINMQRDTERISNLIISYRVEIIVHLLKYVSKYSTMVILINKFQYMDLDDWNITQIIANKIYCGELLDVSLVLAGWSMDTKSLTYLISPEEQEIALNFNKLKKLCWLEFVLPKWTKQEVRDFLKCEFDIEKPSKNVLHFIVNKTDGIPGMIKCLVHDQNLLFLKHGGHLDCSQIERCRDIQSGSRYSDINLPIPYAIQSYYTKMLDSLDQFTLLTIKCAAVIAVGQEFLSVSFSYDMLFSCHPLRSDIQFDDYDNFNNELHSALSLLEKDRFVYKFKQNKLTQEMIRLSDHQDQKHKHDNETFYVFASGFLRDVTYGNMLYKQRSSIHKRVKKMLDRDPFNKDELVQNCIRRHHLLSLHDGFYSNRDEVERKREEILSSKNSRSKNKKIKSYHTSIWSFPECVLVIYIQDVVGLPDTLKSSSYVTIHVGDEKGKSLTSSNSCHQQYMSVVLSENILKQIEDESVGPCLTMRLWYKQNYRVDKTIGKFTLRLRELYEKQLSQQMLWLQRKSELSLMNNNSTHSNNRGSKRNSFNSSNTHTNDSNSVYDHTDLFVGYKMTVHVKQKKINRFHLDKQLYIESFIRFCSVDDGLKIHNKNLESLLPFASQ